jgi:hypothetical protein
MPAILYRPWKLLSGRFQTPSRGGFTRRSVLLGGSALALSPLLGACTQAQTAAWVSAVQSIGQEFLVVQPELTALGVSPNASVTVPGTSVSLNGQAITIAGVSVPFSQLGPDANNLAAALDAASSASQGQSTLITIEAYVNALTPIIWPIVQPIVASASPGAGLAIGLIVASLPAAEQLLNFGVDFSKTFLSGQAQQLAALAPPPAASLRFGGAAPTLTPSQQALVELMAKHGHPSPFVAP